MILQTKIIVVILLIVLSGFFSGAEIALFSLSKLRLRYLVRQKIPGAKTVEKLKKNPQRLLTTILIGNNIVNVGASALAVSIAFDFSLSHAISLTTGIMTLILLVFGEILPKSYAIRHNEKISNLISMPLLMIQTAIFPIVVIFEALSNAVAGKSSISPVVTEEEIKAFVCIGEETGQIRESEKEMIHKIFNFNDLEANDIMTPRNRVVGVQSKLKVGEAIKIFPKKGHSRLPVYDGHLDNITGFIHVMDAQKAKNNLQVKNIERPILFVPSSTKLDSLLKFFQRKKQHMAVVVNEFGINMGIVTIEDVVEEIVGEIIDETEKIEPLIRKISKNSYLVEGRTDIDEINEKCRLKIKSEKPYTISSFILKKIGRFPKKDELIKFNGCEIKIKKMDKNSISKIIISRKKGKA
jgi:putative hemolysin